MPVGSEVENEERTVMRPQRGVQRGVNRAMTGIIGHSVVVGGCIGLWRRGGLAVESFQIREVR
jgi:hypothetical protein